jgi:hypothetical protein
MTPNKKTPVEQLKEKLVSIKVVNDVPKQSQKVKQFDSKRFKELAQKVRRTIQGEDLLRLEATI